MTDHADLHYNKIWAFFAVATTTVMTILITLSYLKERPAEGWTDYDLLYFCMAAIFCIGLAVYFLMNYLIPAIKKQSAVVINADCIIDNINNITIKWQDVKEVGRITGRYSNFILIYLNDPKIITDETNNIYKKLMYAWYKIFYGTPIVISTQFISGNTFDLLNMFLPFLDRQRQVTA